MSDVFNLKSTTDSFNEKLNNVFSGIDKIAAAQPDREYQDVQSDDEDRCASTSNFKKPTYKKHQHKGRKLCDHVKNPHKYTKYSLENVDVGNNATNRAACMDFLNQLKTEKCTDLDSNKDFYEKDSTEEKCDMLKNDLCTSKHLFVKNRIVKKKSPTKKTTKEGKSLVKLSHLDDPD